MAVVVVNLEDGTDDEFQTELDPNRALEIAKRMYPTWTSVMITVVRQLSETAKPLS